MLTQDECIQSKEIGKWVVAQDKKVAKYLKIKPNSIHKARNVFNLSMKKVGNKDVKNICQKCPFMENCLKVGINNSFREDLCKS